MGLFFKSLRDGQMEGMVNLRRWGLIWRIGESPYVGNGGLGFPVRLDRSCKRGERIGREKKSLKSRDKGRKAFWCLRFSVRSQVIAKVVCRGRGKSEEEKMKKRSVGGEKRGNYISSSGTLYKGKN